MLFTLLQNSSTMFILWQKSKQKEQKMRSQTNGTRIKKKTSTFLAHFLWIDRHVPESNPRKMELFLLWNHQRTLSSSSSSNRNFDHHHHHLRLVVVVEHGGVGSKAALFSKTLAFFRLFWRGVSILDLIQERILTILPIKTMCISKTIWTFVSSKYLSVKVNLQDQVHP